MNVVNSANLALICGQHSPTSTCARHFSAYLCLRQLNDVPSARLMMSFGRRRRRRWQRSCRLIATTDGGPTSAEEFKRRLHENSAESATCCDKNAVVVSLLLFVLCVCSSFKVSHLTNWRRSCPCLWIESLESTHEQQQVAWLFGRPAGRQRRRRPDETSLGATCVVHVHNQVDMTSVSEPLVAYGLFLGFGGCCCCFCAHLEA